MIRYHIVLRGMVQGVGLRYFAYCSARYFDITGWVRNCPDGSVELEVQGERECILEFIDRLGNGNGYFSIEDMSVSNIDTIEYENSFRIKY